jgi:hypothetical protein
MIKEELANFHGYHLEHLCGHDDFYLLITITPDQEI